MHPLSSAMSIAPHLSDRIDTIYTDTILDPCRHNLCRAPHPVLVSRFSSSRFYSDWMRDKTKTGLRIFNGVATAMGRAEAWARRFGSADIITKNGRLFSICFFRQPGEKYGYYPARSWQIVPYYYNDEHDWPLGSWKMGENHPNIVVFPVLPPNHEAFSHEDLTKYKKCGKLHHG